MTIGPGIKEEKKYTKIEKHDFIGERFKGFNAIFIRLTYNKAQNI